MSTAALMVAALVAAALFTGCAEKGVKGVKGYQDPCASLRGQIREKQKLDAEVNALAKREKNYRKEGDTASAASAAHRLVGMRENQRLMKESLDQLGSQCHAAVGDPLPVRGPAAKDPALRD